jgi:hypothetical protein
MSTQLKVLTRPGTSPDTYDVTWATGRRVQGIVRVTVTAQVPDLDVVAELSAIQYLLETLEVCGEKRTGKSLHLTASLGAVKKLSKGKSDKPDLYPYALFLRARFAEAEIVVSKDDDGISPEKAGNHIYPITIAEPQLSAIAFFDGFKAELTEHALSQYCQRYQNFSLSSAFRSITFAASHYTTILEKVTLAESSKYGVNARFYFYPDLGLRLVVADHAPCPRIVTVYHSANTAKRFAHSA